MGKGLGGLTSRSKTGVFAHLGHAEYYRCQPSQPPSNRLTKNHRRGEIASLRRPICRSMAQQNRDNLGRERIPIPAEECPAAKVAPVPITDPGARRSRIAYPRGCRRSSRKTPGSKNSGSATLSARSSRRCRGHSPTRSRSSGDSSSRLWQLHQASDRRQIDGGHQRAGVSTDVQTSVRSRTKRQNPQSRLE